jgi:L-amino acid N-acyltransferase YncA
MRTGLQHLQARWPGPIPVPDAAAQTTTSRSFVQRDAASFCAKRESRMGIRSAMSVRIFPAPTSWKRRPGTDRSTRWRICGSSGRRGWPLSWNASGSSGPVLPAEVSSVSTQVCAAVVAGSMEKKWKAVGNMLFRKAETREAEAIRALYQAVIGTPFCTWDESYPGETEIAGDLSASTLYVLEEDHQVIGAISIVPENELDHFNCWALKENAREFARVVIKSDQQHKGLSVYLVEGVIRELQRQGVAAIHIAVAKENIPAQKLYRKTGFDFCGEANMYGHSYFLCERTIEICSVKENNDHTR